MNDVNGGSSSLVVARKNSKWSECKNEIDKWINYETDLNLKSIKPWRQLDDSMHKNRDLFFDIVNKVQQNGHKIAGLGASTKGNVTLQTWGLTTDEIKVIGDKF